MIVYGEQASQSGWLGLHKP